MKDIRIGFIGLGKRGQSLLRYAVIPNGGNVIAVCDAYEDRAQKAADIVKELTEKDVVLKTTDYKEILACKEVNTVIISTAWEYHLEIAIAAMKAGKAIALEVGGAYEIGECFDLVNTWEETRVPFMFLENACYCRRELMVLNMAQQGVFGEIVHCTGAYGHDLRKEVTTGRECRHYRLRNYLNRNCDNYPTHDIGPIAKVLNINHGNRFVSLSSFASKSRGLKAYVEKTKTDYEYLKDKEFAQGDVITTVITCAGGETITLHLDTSLPRYYSRNFSVRGTEGMYEEVTDSVFLDRPEDLEREVDWRTTNNGNADKYAEQYEHPIWQEFLKGKKTDAHGGIDYLEFKYFFKALENDSPMDIDVYDAATWMVISALSEISIQKGGMPIEFPDFTRGKWLVNTVEPLPSDKIVK